MSRTELIIQLLKVALGLAIGAYFVWWTTASGNTVRWVACYKALPHFKRVLAMKRSGVPGAESSRREPGDGPPLN